MNSMIVMKKDQINLAELTPAGQRAGADSGDPQLRVQSLGMETGGRIGIWECQPGGWPVVNRPDTEFAILLSGSATMTDDASGKTVQIGAGDVVILPPGWSGRWDVHETVKKIYVIY